MGIRKGKQTRMTPRFHCPLERKKTERLFKFALVLVNVFFFIALATYAYRGFFSRYWADDYCFGTIFHEHGLFSGTGFFYENTSNRFAAYFLVGLNELFGEKAIRFLPALMIFSTVLIYTKVFALVFQLVKFPQKWDVSLLLSQTLTFFMLFTAPNLFQSIFWRSGMVSYFAPIPFLGLALIVLLSGILHEYKTYMLFLLPVLTFFSAGLSETYAALETGLWLILILAAFGFLKKVDRNRVLKGTVPALMGALLAMLIMIKAPGNTMRLETLKQASSLWQIIYLALRFAASFICHTILGLPAPILVLFATVFILGYHVSGHEQPGIPHSTWLKIMWGSMLAGGVLLVCVAAPTAYGMMAYPEERAWMLGRFVTVMALVLFSFSAGVRSHSYMDRIVDTCLMSIIILILLSLYPLKAAWQEWQQIPQWRASAQAWDARHALVLEKAGNGEQSLIVPAFDSIGTVAELTDDPNYWVNVCAANYYDVEEIIALEELP